MKKRIYIGILLIIVIGRFFLFGSLGEEPSVEKFTEEEGIRDISIDAQRFNFNPGEIRVKQGEKIRLDVKNSDALHGIRIPGLGVFGDEVVEFTATEKGTYEFYCNNYCGLDHFEMKGEIIVE